VATSFHTEQQTWTATCSCHAPSVVRGRVVNVAWWPFIISWCLYSFAKHKVVKSYLRFASQTLCMQKMYGVFRVCTW
jgi:hypothetical protein